MLESNNEFIRGSVAGAIAGIAMYLFIEPFRWLGITKFGLSILEGMNLT